MVAFFSMEYALSDQMPFAGGLGVLAADYLLEAGKQGFPLVAIGLAYDGIKSLDFQKIDNYYFKQFGSAKLYLLDGGDMTRVPYGPDPLTQLKQELFLGFEGVKLLNSLNLKPDVYHLNEGHTAFVILALMKNERDSGRASLARMTSSCWAAPASPIVATKHTVLSASGLHITKEDFFKYVEPSEELYALGSDETHPDFFSTNKFMLRFAKRSNGVSVKHCEVEKEVHQNSPLISITNGINPDRWISEGMLDPASMTDEQLWRIHEENRKKMIDFVNQQTGSTLDPKVLTVVWARRLAEYKQPEILLKILPNFVNSPVQFILAGNACPTDPVQQSISERLAAFKQGNFVFWPHYNLEISKILTSGADVWLNTPIVGKEACGTSGMKAGGNGALLVSTPDGWVIEEPQFGWLLSENDTASSLTSVIANQLIPMFGTPEWTNRMTAIKNLIATKYTTARMLKDYKEKLYNV